MVNLWRDFWDTLQWTSIGIGLWFVASVWLLVNGAPDMFQRFGTVGIFFALAAAAAHHSALVEMEAKAAHLTVDDREPIRKAARENYRLEAMVAGTATLQTGFGDMLHTWLHGLAG